MIYNQVSSKRIIAKVLTDLNLQEEDHRIPDCIEWIGEAVEQIGSFYAYDIKITGKEDLPLITVSDYQAKLPADLISLIGVKYSTSINGSFIPLRYGTNIYGYRGEDTNTITEEATSDNASIISLAMSLYDWDYETALSNVNSDSVLKSKLNTLLISDNSVITNNNNFYSDNYVYYINNSYIKLNFKNGYLKMAYQAMPLDEESYPIIPDDKDFIEACYWYVTMKLKYPDWLNGRIPSDRYFDIEAKWKHFSNKAYGNSMMPNIDKWESLSNQWLKIYPELDEFDNDFSSLGQKQIIYNH